MGPYPPSDENAGLIDFDAFLNLVQVVNYRAFAEFHVRRQELFDKRVELLRQKHMEEYRNCIGAVSKEFSDIYYKAKHDALVFLEISEKSFDATVTDAKEKPASRVELDKVEHEVRAKVEEMH